MDFVQASVQEGEVAAGRSSQGNHASMQPIQLKNNSIAANGFK